MKKAPIKEPKKAFWAKCAKCSHCWAAAYYPIELHLISKILKGLHCPMCGAAPEDLRIAKQHDGELQETMP